MYTNTYKYRATHYTGANVSIFIGPHLLTQCFGISWQLSQNRRPIYGYNDQYFSGVADGTVLVTGQLFLNFTHPQYLSTLLNKYYSFNIGVRNAIRNGNHNDLLSYVSAYDSIEPLANIIRDAVDPELGLGRDGILRDRSYQPINVLNSLTENETIDAQIRQDQNNRVADRLDLNMSNSQRVRAMDEALDYVFNNPDVQADLLQFFTGGINSSTISNESGESYSVFSSDRLNSLVERNQPENMLHHELMVNARPDQFGSAASSPYGIDIAVWFGPPYSATEENQIYNYSESSSFVLKDVFFNGEAGQIMMDDQPVMETYSFFARKKEPLIRGN